jgi:hypothetical protein
VQLAAARLAGLGAQRGQALEVGRLGGRGALAGRLEHGLGGGVALAGRRGVGNRGAEHRLPAAQLRVAGLGGGDLLVGADERGGRAHPRALGLGTQIGPQPLHVGHLLCLVASAWAAPWRRWVFSAAICGLSSALTVWVAADFKAEPDRIAVG